MEDFMDERPLCQIRGRSAAGCRHAASARVRHYSTPEGGLIMPGVRFPTVNLRSGKIPITWHRVTRHFQNIEYRPGI
ncbi:MAG: hypothetical protein AB2814_12570, partial [Candidatus Sedimenticola endophacoides]